MIKKIILAAVTAAMLTQSSAMLMVQASGTADSSMELAYTDGVLTWYIDSTYSVLTIEGPPGSKMNEYEQTPAPWAIYSNTVTQINIENGVTSIGRNAFNGFTALQNVSIPNSLATVGDGAFFGCSLLDNVTFPAGLYSIGIGSFAGCTSLSSIEIPWGTRTIGEGAFAGCTSLATYKAPFIGERQYPGTDLANETIYFVFGNSVPSSLRTVEITNDKGIAPGAFEGCADIRNITVNSAVQVIGERAFKGCEDLQSFVIPSGVPEINDETFMDCNSITSIVIPDSVQAIGTSAFENCYKVDGLYVPYGIKVINDYTFKNCSSLTTLSIPLTVNKVGSEVMMGCNSLVSLKVPFIGESRDAGMKGWEAKGVFGYLFGYTTVPFGETVSGAAYQYLDDSMKYYYFVPKTLKTVEVDNRAFDRYGEIDDTITIVPVCAFANCRFIQHIAINAGKTVYQNAFRNCKSLKSLALPDSVSAIKENILYNSQNVESISVPFTGSSRNDQGKLTSTIGYFWGYDFEQTGLDTEQYYDKDNSAYYHIPTSLRDVVISNAADLPYGAFINCDQIRTVVLGRTGIINEKAFADCQKLTDVTLSADLEEIGYEGFVNCKNLRSINVPKSCKEIGKRAFYGDDALESLFIPGDTDVDDDVMGEDDLSSQSEDMLELMAAKNYKWYVIEGSEAHQTAVAKGIDFEIVTDSAFEVITTTTTYLGGGQFTVVDNTVNAETRNVGTVYVVAYDENDNFLAATAADADGSGTYNATIQNQDALENMDHVIVMFWDKDSKPLLNPEYLGKEALTKENLEATAGADTEELPNNENANNDDESI